jgi:hypothetical protein
MPDRRDRHSRALLTWTLGWLDPYIVGGIRYAAGAAGPPPTLRRG